MIAVPFSLGRPSWAASHPCYEHLCRDPTPPPGFLSRTFWYAGCKRSDIAGITTGGRLAHLLKDAIEWEYRQSVRHLRGWDPVAQ
jgi:hypothetical protein